MSDQSLMIRGDGDLVKFSESAEALKESALQSCALIGSVKDDAGNALAFTAFSEIDGLIKAVEKARVKVKEPFLEACRSIDASAKKFVEDAIAERTRVNGLITEYQSTVRERAAKIEAERQAELRRVEQERIEAEREVLRKAAAEEAARIAEANRIAAEEAAKRKAELDRIAAEEAKANSAKEKARLEAQRAELEKQRLEQEAARVEREAKDKAEAAAKAEAELLRQAELAKQAAEAVGPAAIIKTAKGQSVREVWDYEVTDIHLLYKMHPGFVTITDNRAEILQALKMGHHEIKGVRVFKDVRNGGRQQKVIEV